MMKRRVIQLVLLLMAGAIVNVAVAWGGLLLCEGRGFFKYDVFEYRRTTDARATALWNRFAQDGWSQPPPWHQAGYGPFVSVWTLGISVSGSYMIPLDATFEELKEIHRGGGTFEVEQIDCGFPFASMRLERAYGQPMTPYFKASRHNDGVNLGGLTLPKRALPVRFAINTIFYAAILWGGWVVFFVPGQVKRTLRRRRGLCPACAYPIGTSPVCTECGKALA